MKKHFMLIGSLLFSSMVFGQAYQLNLQGMKQFAMGGAGAATPWDVSTIFYNPAGLTSIRNLQVSGNVNLIMPRTRYVSAPTGTETVDAAEKNYIPFSGYVGAPVGYKSPLSLGLGIYKPFGTGIDWGNDWTGRFLVQSMRLRTTFFQPTASYMLTDDISIGAGFIWATGYYENNRALPVYDLNGTEGSTELSGRMRGVGFNLGLHIKASEYVHFGITYRSQVNMKVNNGYANFSVPSSISQSYPGSAFNTEIPMPQVATVGMGWDISESVGLQLEASYIGWAAYDSLRIDYADNSDLLMDEQSARRYRNTVALRGGVNYAISDKISAMAGLAFVPSPVREGYLSPEMPDAKRFIGSAGLSVQVFTRLSAVAAVQYSYSEVRTGSSLEHGFTGKYQTQVLTPGLGVVLDLN